jgi:selenium-dependent xanthine dehydrogenase
MEPASADSFTATVWVSHPAAHHGDTWHGRTTRGFPQSQGRTGARPTPAPATDAMDFTLNGRPVSVAVDPSTPLLTVLRERLGLRSMKDGCAPEGSCGACTVIVDGRAVVSCAQAVGRVEGRTVETLEGLDEAERRRWADAFTLSGASQCGYCSPGIVMKAEALLRREPAPDRDGIAHALAGNLCRCTGYIKILDAVETVAADRAGRGIDQPGAPGRDGVGTRTDRIGAGAMALGEQVFVGDMVVPGMLHGALRLSDHPRAVVRRIDVSRAVAAPGVIAAVTAADVPGERVQGLLTRDWPVFVAEGETTRYVGDVLAAVAAETSAQARAAAARIEVEYDVLEPVTDPLAALEPEAPLVHEAGNLLETSIVRRGDVAAALGSAAHVVRERFTTSPIDHAFLEPEACLAIPRGASDPMDDGVDGGPAAEVAAVHLYSQGQGAWDDRRQVASLLGLPETAVRVTQVPTGGAFGGKEDLSVQGQAALLAHVARRPVLLTLAREESLRLHPKRHATTLDYEVACDADGRLTAVMARIVGDTGAYASVGAKVLERAAGHACGAYRVPNVDVEARTVYTNNAPAGAFRGFGVPQATFAMDGCLDRLAEQVGIDGWEIRWRNACRTGDRFGTGQRLGPGVGLERTLLAVRDAYDRARTEGRAVGIACGAKNVGVGNGVVERGRAILRVEPDATLTLWHSWTEMGQGVHTVFSQIVAEELGVDAARVRVLVDTERELDTGETTASRATTLGGEAVARAARDARRALDALPPGADLEALAGREFEGEYVVDWTTPLGEGIDEPVTHLAYGWATQVVILDAEGRVERVVAAQDVGRAMNPTLLEGQVEGGVHMGLGLALTEAYVAAAGVPATTTLKSLGIIPAASMPKVDVIVVEEAQPEGPYGAKGAGEAVLVPTPAAVAGALRAFDGRWRTALPMRDSNAARAALPRVDRLPTAGDAPTPGEGERTAGGGGQALTGATAKETR